MEIGEKSEHKLKASAALLKHQMTGNPEKDYLYRGSLYGPLDIVGSNFAKEEQIRETTSRRPTASA